MQAPSYNADSLLSEPPHDSGAASYVAPSGMTAAENRSISRTSSGGSSSLLTLPLVTKAVPGESAERARRLRVALLAARVLGDGMLLVIASLTAYWLRFEVELGGSTGTAASNLPLQVFILYYLLTYVATSMLWFQMRGLYALPRGASWLAHMRVISSAALTSMSLLVLGTLLFNATLPSRLLLLFLWLSTIAIFATERLLYRELRVKIWQRGINIRRVLVVGAGIAGQRIMKDIVERTSLGYELIGYVADSDHEHGTLNWKVPINSRLGCRLRRLGDVKDVQEIMYGRERPLHEVIVALPATRHTEILSIVDSCRECGIEFRLVPDLFEMHFSEVRMDALNGVPLIGVKDVALRGFNLFLKRLLDLALAAGMLAIMAIPMLIIAAVIRSSSPGPIFFRQQRVGKGGRLFTCYKFRSMYQDAEKHLDEIRHLNEVDGPIFKMKDDPRITAVGKVLRRASLDELPQIFNILKGEMSWVGPRPPIPAEVARYDEWHHKRLEVTPGLTGLWQVSGRSNLSFDEMVKLDLYYAESWSLSLDLTVILRTLPVLVKREGAY